RDGGQGRRPERARGRQHRPVHRARRGEAGAAEPARRLVPGQPAERHERLGPGGGGGEGVIGLYVHVPYCTVRCSYCDFYLVPARGRDLDAFVDALCGEIASIGAPLLGRDADTIHFGGGTPSILSPEALDRVVRALRESFAVAPQAEIALEANPEDTTQPRLEAWHALGVNRVSIGVQSLDDALLRRMRRPHDAPGALAAVAAARRSPVRSVGVDLILGLPGQDSTGALADLARVVDLGVDHVSLYLLEVHE